MQQDAKRVWRFRGSHDLFASPSDVPCPSAVRSARVLCHFCLNSAFLYLISPYGKCNQRPLLFCGPYGACLISPAGIPSAIFHLSPGCNQHSRQAKALTQLPKKPISKISYIISLDLSSVKRQYRTISKRTSSQFSPCCKTGQEIRMRTIGRLILMFGWHVIDLLSNPWEIHMPPLPPPVSHRRRFRCFNHHCFCHQRFCHRWHSHCFFCHHRSVIIGSTILVFTNIGSVTVGSTILVFINIGSVAVGTAIVSSVITGLSPLARPFLFLSTSVLSPVAQPLLLLPSPVCRRWLDHSCYCQRRFHHHLSRHHPFPCRRGTQRLTPAISRTIPPSAPHALSRPIAPIPIFHGSVSLSDRVHRVWDKIIYKSLFTNLSVNAILYGNVCAGSASPQGISLRLAESPVQLFRNLPATSAFQNLRNNL